MVIFVEKSAHYTQVNTVLLFIVLFHYEMNYCVRWPRSHEIPMKMAFHGLLQGTEKPQNFMSNKKNYGVKIH